VEARDAARQLVMHTMTCITDGASMGSVLQWEAEKALSLTTVSTCEQRRIGHARGSAVWSLPEFCKKYLSRKLYFWVQVTYFPLKRCMVESKCPPHLVQPAGFLLKVANGTSAFYNLPKVP
jgi:hypothetical protein